MKALIFFLLVGVSQAGTFQDEAPLIASRLKTNLLKILSEKLAKEGTLAAIPFCQNQVAAIGKEAAGALKEKYDFGRTSHKVRNQKNIPMDWMIQYLEEYKGTLKGAKKGSNFVTSSDGKKAYFEALYVQPLCLQCHGENISPQVHDSIRKLYPKDKATGFKLNEFRGLLWVKEK
jgi:Protein of unknown function (DUF3365)